MIWETCIAIPGSIATAGRPIMDVRHYDEDEQCPGCYQGEECYGQCEECDGCGLPGMRTECEIRNSGRYTPPLYVSEQSIATEYAALAIHQLWRDLAPPPGFIDRT